MTPPTAEQLIAEARTLEKRWSGQGNIQSSNAQLYGQLADALATAQQRIQELDADRELSREAIDGARARIQELEASANKAADAVTQMSREVRSFTKRYEERIQALEQERDDRR